MLLIILCVISYPAQTNSILSKCANLKMRLYALLVRMVPFTPKVHRRAIGLLSIPLAIFRKTLQEELVSKRWPPVTVLTPLLTQRFDRALQNTHQSRLGFSSSTPVGGSNPTPTTRSGASSSNSLFNRIHCSATNYSVVLQRLTKYLILPNET